MEDLDMAFIFIAGFRVSSKLVYVEKEEQIYKYKTRKEQFNYYYCYKKGCKAGVSVDTTSLEQRCRRIAKNNLHDHGSQQELYKKLEIMNSIKRDVQNAATLKKRTSIKDIFEENCKKYQDASHLLDYEKMRRQLFNIKKEQLPQSPMNFQDIAALFQNQKMYKKFGVSKYEKNFKPFYIDTVIADNFSYSVFVSHTIRNHLLSTNSWLSRVYTITILREIMPQTNVFQNLLIFNIVHENHSYPFIYVLMSQVTGDEAYVHLLHYIKTNLMDLNPSKVIYDFDAQFRNAFEAVYPTAKLVECWYHYINALRIKSSEIPYFVETFNNDKAAAHLFNKFLYLPLFKPEDLLAAYQMLQEESMEYFKPFIKYYDFEWIQKIKPENFSIYQEPIKTNNPRGSSYMRLMQWQEPEKGVFYKLLNILRDVDKETSAMYVRSISGSLYTDTSIDTFSKSRDEFIQKWLMLLDEKKISLSEVLNQFSYSNKITMSEEFLKDISIINSPIPIQPNFAEEAEPEEDEDDDNETTEVFNMEIETKLEDDKSQIQKCLLCVLCYERERQLLFFPCRHFKVCSQCYEQMAENAKSVNSNPICTSCRLEVNSVLPIFC